MKKTAVLLFLFIGLGMSVIAQPTVSTAITDQFQKMHANAENVDWKEDDNGNIVAYFKLESNDAKTVFSPDAAWIKTVIFIGEDKLPDAIVTTIKATFSGDFTYTEVERIKTSENVKYEAEIKLGGSLYKILLDEGGNLLKKEEI